MIKIKSGLIFIAINLTCILYPILTQKQIIYGMNKKMFKYNEWEMHKLNGSIE